MLSASEFTVDSVTSAEPSSLILPRHEHEVIAIVGTLEGEPVAVFLSGRFRLCFIEIAGAHNWSGLIIRSVRIEVDESSIFDPDRNDAPAGSVIRMGDRLVIRAIADGPFRQATAITLQGGLSPTGDRLRAGFARWQVVIGAGVEKRVLLR